MDIRAFTSGLPNAICMTDLALKPKNHPTSGLVKAWYCKKICNTATVPLQICNGIVAVFQNKITIFYSPLYICHFLSLHLVSSSLSLSLSLSLSRTFSVFEKSRHWRWEHAGEVVVRLLHGVVHGFWSSCGDRMGRD